MDFVNILKTIWSIIVGSLRIILFICLSILLILSVIGTLYLLVRGNEFNTISFPTTHSYNRLVFESFMFIGILLLGCHGSFYNNKKNLKLFSFLMAIYMLIMAIDLFNTNMSEFSPENIKYKEEMIKLQSKYSWDHKFDSEESRIATMKWDVLQSLGCCGFKSRKEWNSTRPIGENNDVYPKSCCVQGLVSHYKDLCTSDDAIFMTPCIKRVEMIQFFALIASICTLGLFFILTLMAFVIISDKSCDSSGANKRVQTAEVPTTIATMRGPAGQEYTRFDNSVYIRQPPINVEHNELSVPKNKSIYPNAYEGEKNFSYEKVPPPSYNPTKQ